MPGNQGLQLIINDLLGQADRYGRSSGDRGISIDKRKQASQLQQQLDNSPETLAQQLQNQVLEEQLRSAKGGQVQAKRSMDYSGGLGGLGGMGGGSGGLSGYLGIGGTNTSSVRPGGEEYLEEKYGTKEEQAEAMALGISVQELRDRKDQMGQAEADSLTASVTNQNTKNDMLQVLAELLPGLFEQAQGGGSTGGGSNRMPPLEDMLKQMFNRTPTPGVTRG